MLARSALLPPVMARVKAQTVLFNPHWKPELAKPLGSWSLDPRPRVTGLPLDDVSCVPGAQIGQMFGLERQDPSTRLCPDAIYDAQRHPVEDPTR